MLYLHFVYVNHWKSTSTWCFQVQRGITNQTIRNDSIEVRTDCFMFSSKIYAMVQSDFLYSCKKLRNKFASFSIYVWHCTVRCAITFAQNVCIRFWTNTLWFSQRKCYCQISTTDNSMTLQYFMSFKHFILLEK